MPSYNLGSTWYLTPTFKDRDGDPAIPTTATYRVDDLKSRTAIVAETAFADGTAHPEIELQSAVNQMVNEDLDSEVHVVTVRATYGAGDAVEDQYQFVLMNLPF